MLKTVPLEIYHVLNAVKFSPICARIFSHRVASTVGKNGRLATSEIKSDVTTDETIDF